ncbi:kinesin-like protein KIN-12A [Vicia villosa]|uniref:kinesin-like protein KIN-12A n=1 Tax=Vicia villosa TaxID=3911 RepID=UPI00273B95F2|nr:kinesin-like protein KIN-12A [Vicia villosa]
MWGPANSLAEAKEQQELTPRVFERLFPRIKEEQTKHSDQQFNYQCNCSFLEIYNEQITYLLDPSQRNLQIREDVKSSVYVENLTENQVSTMEDVTQLLLKVHRCDQYRKNTVVGILQAEHVVNITCLSKGGGFHFPPCHMLNFCGIRILLDCPLDLSALMAFSPVPTSLDALPFEESNNNEKRQKI